MLEIGSAIASLLSDSGRHIFNRAIYSLFEGKDSVPHNENTQLDRYLDLLRRDLECVNKKLDEQRLAELYGGFSQLRDARLTRVKNESLAHALNRFQSIASIPTKGRTGEFCNAQLRSLAYLGMAVAHRLLDDSDQIVADKLLRAVDVDPFTSIEFIGYENTERLLQQMNRTMPLPGSMISFSEKVFNFTKENECFDLYCFLFLSGGVTVAAKKQFWRIVNLWNIETGELLRTLSMGDSNVENINTLSFDPTRAILAIGGYGSVRLWNVETGDLVQTLNAKSLHGDHGFDVQSVAFQPNSSICACATGVLIMLFDIEKGMKLKELKCPEPDMIRNKKYTEAISVDFAPEADILASLHSNRGSKDHDPAYSWLLGDVYDAFGSPGRRTERWQYSFIYLWSVKTGDLLKTIKNTENLTSISFDRSGSILAATNNDVHDSIFLWDVSTGEMLRTLKTAWTPKDISFHPEGRVLAVANHVYGIEFFDIETGELLRTIEVKDNCINKVAFHPDGHRLVSADARGYVTIWGR